MTSSDDSQSHVALATGFSQISGLLAGFCITFVALALSSGNLLSDDIRDLVISILLIASGFYIASAGLSANATNPTYPREWYGLWDNAGIALFSLGNVLLTLDILVIIFQFPLILSRAAATLLFITAVIVLLLNATQSWWSRFFFRRVSRRR